MARGKREHRFQNQASHSAGVDAGSRLRSSGNGEAGFRGGPPGISTSCCMSRRMKFSSAMATTCSAKVAVSFVQAALGAEIEVPTLDAERRLKSPPARNPARPFASRARAVKNLQATATAICHVRVQVEVPTLLNHEQKAKLQEFAESCGEDANPISKSFFEKAKNCSSDK